MSENNLRSVAFPKLDETQIGKLAGCTKAELKLFRDGQVLFAVGQRNMNFFVVKSGEVEIVDRSGDEPRTVTIHRPGEFTGDISHLTGLPAPADAQSQNPYPEPAPRSSDLAQHHHLQAQPAPARHRQSSPTRLCSLRCHRYRSLPTAGPQSRPHRHLSASRSASPSTAQVLGPPPSLRHSPAFPPPATPAARCSSRAVTPARDTPFRSSAGCDDSRPSAPSSAHPRPTRRSRTPASHAPDRSI